MFVASPPTVQVLTQKHDVCTVLRLLHPLNASALLAYADTLLSHLLVPLLDSGVAIPTELYHSICNLFAGKCPLWLSW